jgi:hypothetical protein
MADRSAAPARNGATLSEARSGWMWERGGTYSDGTDIFERSPMNGLRVRALLAALLAGAALNAFAQATPTDPAKPAAAAKNDAPAAPKKVAPAPRDAAKKAAPKKAAEKKAEKKTGQKVQKAAPAGTAPVTEKYKAGEAPNLKGRDGNVIQTSPDAYNIDSAIKK